MRKLLVLTLALLCGLSALAQKPQSDFSSREIEAAYQQFLDTDNAAGMGLFQPLSGSKTQIEGLYKAGDDHLSQVGTPEYGFDFSTLRYDSFSDKLFMRGSFHYSFSREKERKWSDVIDPWFSIPYIYGNSVAKDYDKHNCGLTFDLYTAPLAGWISVGVRTRYEVADISGLRDPRPRTGYLNWQVVPSVLFSFGRHHIGLDFGYGYSKEKLSGLTTIQTYPNLYYYKMFGLDRVDGSIGGFTGFKRQFYGGRFMGEISYNYVEENFRALVSAGLEYSVLEAYGDKKQAPGAYDAFLYHALADIQLQSGSLLHRWHIKGSIKDAGAHEFLQELVSVKDPQTSIISENWVTIYEYRNRYMLKQYKASLDYTLYGARSGKDYRWSVVAGAAYSAFKKESFLPYSEFTVKTLGFNLGGSVRLMEVSRHKLELSADAALCLPLKVSQGLMAENDYTREVLEPDAVYYRKTRIGGDAAIVWIFPMNLGKAGIANGYVRLGGDYRKALGGGQLWDASITVGLFTF